METNSFEPPDLEDEIPPPAPPIFTSARFWIMASGVLLLLGFLAADLMPRGPVPPRAAGPLAQEAYLWQRSWDDAVRAGLRRTERRFAGVVVLAAEMDWEHGRPRVARVIPDYAVLRENPAPVGLALRVGPYAGPFSETTMEGADVPAARGVADLAAELLREAAEAGLTVKELQIDFDCADSKLDGYCLWINAIRRRIGSTSLVITALPSWLDRPAFKNLAEAADGFVLQVHSLERPTRFDAPLTLCDPAAARRAVEKAARLGRPFRVALATYGYFVAFNRDGQFLGLQAEGPALHWPPDVRLRVLRADPTATAELVRAWTADRPACLQGLLWYRLPIDTDALNWRWPTLAAVMDGRTPRGELRAAARRTEPGLFEIDITNNGAADEPLPAMVRVRWTQASFVAADALAGFELDEKRAEPSHQIQFRFRPEMDLEFLAPEQRRTLGWLRLNADTEVSVDVAPLPP